MVNPILSEVIKFLDMFPISKFILFFLFFCFFNSGPISKLMHIYWNAVNIYCKLTMTFHNRIFPELEVSQHK